MKRILFISIVFLLKCELFGQVAIVRDPDGFVNVREGASSKSRIIDTLHNERLLYVTGGKGDWLEIMYNVDHLGYIHKSRLVELNEPEKFKIVKTGDSIFHIGGEDVEIVFVIRKFDSSDRKLSYKQYDGEMPFLAMIDGKHFYGTDGTIPRTEYRSIIIKQGQREYQFPREMYRDLFEPNLETTELFFEEATGRYYIGSMNSDGAGGYRVYWAIKDGKVLSREIFRGF